MDLYEELVSVVDILIQSKIDFALCGGVAVAFHGYSRFTKDIDLLIQLGDVEKLKHAVDFLGFKFFSGPIAFGGKTLNRREIYRISKIENKEVLTLDLVVVNALLEDVWQDREVFEWKGRMVPVVSALGLCKMKRLASRDQDILDIKMLGFLDEN